MAVTVRPKHLYGYRGHHYPAWRAVIIGKYAWGVFKFYKAKASAEKALRGLKMGQSRRTPYAVTRMVKTVRGWAVVQRSPTGPYRTLAANPNLYLAE